MTRSVLLCLVFLCCCFGVAHAQTGKLSGRITDKKTKEAIFQTDVVVKLNGSVKGHAVTDDRGNYSVSPLTPGTYEVQFVNMAYQKSTRTGVVVQIDKTTFVNAELNDASVELGVAEVVQYQVPIISKDETSTGGTLTREQILRLPTREVATMAATVPGVYAADDNARVNVKGTRENSTTYYINGVKVNSNVTPQLPTTAISQITVISGGVPAQYGDAVGGIINITTSSPSAQYAGGIEAETSTLFNKYNTSLGNFNLSGPIVRRRAPEGGTSPGALLGFFVSGQYQTAKDDAPLYDGLYQVKDAKLKEVQANPFTYDPQTGTINRSSELLRLADFEKVKVRPNATTRRQSYNGSIDFQPVDNILFTVGGSFDRYMENRFFNDYSLLNSDNNPRRVTQNWNAFARFTQNFPTAAGDSNSLLKNAYYQVQGDFARFDRVVQRDKYKDNLARYGYIGQINENLGNSVYVASERVYPIIDANGDTTARLPIRDQVGLSAGQLNFIPSGDNPLSANYTAQLLSNQEQFGTITNLDALRGIQGNRNGDNPQLVQNVYSNSGAVFNQYLLQKNDQYRVSALGAAEIGKHTVKVGMEFEQRIESFYNAAPLAIWNAGRGLINNHITFFDINSPNGGVRLETLPNGTQQAFQDYNTTANDATESTFSRNIRRKLGVANNERINLDAINPDLITVADFSADEAIQNGVLNNYQGYTYTGKRQTKRVAFSDFFTDLQNRPQDAYRPTYAAVFLEDKFAIEDLIIRAGVRVDRFDANQKVLKDKYSLVDLVKVDDIRGQQFANGSSYQIPSTIPGDAAIYVNTDQTAFTGGNSQALRITGYRSGDQFYTANGAATDNFQNVQSNGATYPLFNTNAQGSPTPGAGLEYLADRKLSLRAFRDYKPQINVMPRVSFSFPISEDALFFAHYDILTQRPENNPTLPSDYYFLLGSVFGNNSNTLNNPDLKPQRKIDFQVGFEQRLTQSSGLTISAFYSELRDLIQYRPVYGAYPIDYLTFANIDFGTVKGMTLEYDLRRTKNVAFNASYTLQFAKGTGSSSTSGLNLAAQGQPNLRVPVPLDYDQRNIAKASLDFRFAQGEGPVAFGQRFLQNAGLNILVQGGSGTPYTRQSNITQSVSTGVQQRASLQGVLNGSRLPATARVALRIDKDFALKIGDKQLPVIKTLNIYFRVQNLLNSANVLRVYRYTGSATDDGFVNDQRLRLGTNPTALGLSQLDLYQAKLLSGGNGDFNPSNFSLPRRILIGMTLTF